MDNFYERNAERKRNKPKGKPKNPMTRVIAVQLALSLLVTGIFYAVCRTDSNLSNEIKSFYCAICEKDIAVSSIIDMFKNVAKETFAPTLENENSTEETKDTAGEKVSFSPVFICKTI